MWDQTTWRGLLAHSLTGVIWKTMARMGSGEYQRSFRIRSGRSLVALHLRIFGPGGFQPSVETRCNFEMIWLLGRSIRYFGSS